MERLHDRPGPVERIGDPLRHAFIEQAFDDGEAVRELDGQELLALEGVQAPLADQAALTGVPPDLPQVRLEVLRDEVELPTTLAPEGDPGGPQEAGGHLLLVRSALDPRQSGGEERDRLKVTLGEATPEQRRPMRFLTGLVEFPPLGVEFRKDGLQEDLDVDRAGVVRPLGELGEDRDERGTRSDRSQGHDHRLEPLSHGVGRHARREGARDPVAELGLALREPTGEEQRPCVQEAQLGLERLALVGRDRPHALDRLAQEVLRAVEREELKAELRRLEEVPQGHRAGEPVEVVPRDFDAAG